MSERREFKGLLHEHCHDGFVLFLPGGGWYNDEDFVRGFEGKYVRMIIETLDEAEK